MLKNAIPILISFYGSPEREKVLLVLEKNEKKISFEK
jgi:hypothetical protein